MTEIEKLTAMIKSEALCNNDTFLNYESRIDDRFMPAFETAWIECFEKLKEVELCDELSSQLKVLREAAYIAAYNFTEDPDLAALVSDDFELIGKSAVTSTVIPWLNGLWVVYRNGGFPTGDIQATEGDLASLLTSSSKNE